MSSRRGHRRRLSINLTPLLDLLLVLLFAHFALAQQHVQEQSESTAVAQQERAAAQEEKEAADELQATSRRTASECAEKVADLTQELDECKEDREAEKRDIEAERKALGKGLAALFDADEADMRELAEAMDPHDRAAILEQLEELADAKAESPQALVQHLRRFDEIQKHVDLWDIRLDGRDRAKLEIPGQLPLALSASSLACERDLQRHLQSLGGTNDLILVFVAWDGDTTNGARLQLDECLEGLNEQIRSLLGGDITVRVARLGILAEGEDD